MLRMVRPQFPEILIMGPVTALKTCSEEALYDFIPHLQVGNGYPQPRITFLKIYTNSLLLSTCFSTSTHLFALTSKIKLTAT